VEIKPMLRKDLARYEPELIDQRREWESFLGLIGVLALEAADRRIYDRCRDAIRQLWPKTEMSGDELARAAGLDFYSRTLQFDVVLARLANEAVIAPIRTEPFRFQMQVAEGQPVLRPERKEDRKEVRRCSA
jgi:hypothetical protein